MPDWNNLTYRRIKTTYSKITSPNKDFMSIRDVERDLQRYFKDKIYELEQEERDYARILNRCDDSKGQLYKIDFPVNIDKCPVLENKIQTVQYEILFQQKVQEARKEEIRHQKADESFNKMIEQWQTESEILVDETLWDQINIFES